MRACVCGLLDCTQQQQSGAGRQASKECVMDVDLCVRVCVSERDGGNFWLWLWCLAFAQNFRATLLPTEERCM